jgi:hypothetical protein
VKLQSTTGEFIQLFELEVYSKGNNVVLGEGTTATQSSTFKNSTKFAATNVIDWEHETFSHTGEGDLSAYLEVDWNRPFIIENVLMMNRWCQATSDPSGCLCRLSSATLALLDENDSVIATRVIGDTCNQLVVEDRHLRHAPNRPTLPQHLHILLHPHPPVQVLLLPIH